MNTSVRALAVIVGLLVPVVISGQGNWKDALDKALRSKYGVTKASMWDPNNITQPGTVFVVQQDGVGSEPTIRPKNMGELAQPDNKVTDGKVASKGGLSILSTAELKKTLNKGERVYLQKIDVKNDKLLLSLLTVNVMEYQYGGSTLQSRYYANLEFPQPNLAQMDADSVAKMISAVIVPEAEANAVQTKSVELGQSMEQVEAVLGKPDKIIKLGEKVVYVYKDMKIIFMNGKVADVQ